MNRPVRIGAALVLLASAAACAGKSTSTNAAATDAPAARPTLPATPTPAAVISRGGTPKTAPILLRATLAPVVAATAKPTLSPLAGVVLAPPNAPPRILKISQSPSELHGGTTATFTVTTTSNVASVELRAVTFGSSMKRPKIGTFTLSEFVPPLPPFMPHTFAVSFIARNTAGDKVTRVQSITVH